MVQKRTTSGPEYWRSLDELAGTPTFQKFVAAEFPSLAPQFADATTRRQFLKVMGASLALAGLAGCRWPKENIVPATRQPLDRIPGVPVQYATTFELGGVATGLLVTSYDGRPIKIEGNEKHPFSRGKTNHWMQASILDLYDPDRSQRPVERRPADGAVAAYRTWDEFEAFTREHFSQRRAVGGAGLAVLSEASSSPSLADMRTRWARVVPQARWYEHELLSRTNELEGARLAFGKPYRTLLRLDQADVIVSLDSDFLMTHPAAVKYAGDFAARRRADDGTMNRLYVLESGLSVTGSNADQRYALRSSAIKNAALLLAQHLSHLPVLQRAALLRADQVQPTAELPFLAGIAADLAGHQGRSVVIAGPQQPAEVHALVHWLNAALGNVGQTVTYVEEPGAPVHTLAELCEQMHAGAVDTLLILGGNPVHGAPVDVRFQEALAKVKTSIHLSQYDNETSHSCTWHVPQAHYLEAWGDAQAWDGTASLIQPLIEPFYGGRTSIELLALISGDDRTKGYEIVRRTFSQVRQDSTAGAADFETAWKHALHDGVVPDSVWPAQQPTLLNLNTPEPPAWAARVQRGGAPAAPGEWEIVFAPDYSLHDGRFANNAWLQEMPDPITKLTWDNAALSSAADAEKLGLKTYGDVVRIEHDGRTLDLPAYILPGHADGSITLPVGYGRGPFAGVVADGAGLDVCKLRTSAAPFIATGAKVTATGRHYDLASTQDHHAIQSKVGDEEIQNRIGLLVHEATLAHYQKHPDFAAHAVHLPVLQSLWQEKEYKDHKWGLSIDLSACIGCSACVVACQAENNVPVVGKDEVLRGREMHWLRVDRYFKKGIKGSRDQGIKDVSTSQPAHLDPLIPRSLDPSISVVHQPMMCVHCENAPCEQVCPVAATVHDEEGLNVMVYNRCVGTRYCSNNCPFKVRRFNWFFNHHGPSHPRSIKGDAFHMPGKLKEQPLTDLEKMVNNPSVTVRSRGVMEKCTYCTQRISAVKIKAKNERWDRIPDGLITPACAQACPTDAIVFGDLNDPTSRVRKLHDHQRSYAPLAELNIKPRTKYLARLSNPAEPERDNGPT